MRKTVKGVIYFIASFGLLLISASFAMAAETAASGSVDYAKAGVIAISIIGAVVSIVMGAYTVGPAMGKVTSDSTTAISRNPDASGKIMVAMVVGMAMTESICIYTLVISLIVIYANPLLKYIFV